VVGDADGAAGAASGSAAHGGDPAGQTRRERGAAWRVARTAGADQPLATVRRQSTRTGFVWGAPARAIAPAPLVAARPHLGCAARERSDLDVAEKGGAGFPREGAATPPFR